MTDQDENRTNLSLSLSCGMDLHSLYRRARVAMRKAY